MKNEFLFFLRFPVIIQKMIISYRNHVKFAFRRSLMIDVNYPNNNINKVLDDAHLIINLNQKVVISKYINTDININT